MKKKFLSLMMAAAVVATTSVSAFANTKDYDVEDTKEIEHPVKITGDIENEQGQVRPGTLSVTVPTKAAFRVDKKGGFDGGSLRVVNRGDQSVQVYVNQFIDTDGEAGVNVVSAEKTAKAAESSEVNRKSVSLNIKGNSGTAYLGTAPGTSGKGVYEDDRLTREATNGKLVSEINGNSEDTLNLRGEAGKKVEAIKDAIQNDFTLKLAIRKTPKKPVSESATESVDQQ